MYHALWILSIKGLSLRWLWGEVSNTAESRWRSMAVNPGILIEHTVVSKFDT